MREQVFVRPLLFLVGGLVVWAAHFGVVYAVNALACARGFAGASVAGWPAVPGAIALATLIAVLALGAIAWAVRSGRTPALPDGAAPRTRRFLDHVALTIVGIALLGVVWDAVPAYLLPPCA